MTTPTDTLPTLLVNTENETTGTTAQPIETMPTVNTEKEGTVTGSITPKTTPSVNTENEHAGTVTQTSKATTSAENKTLICTRALQTSSNTNDVTEQDESTKEHAKESSVNTENKANAPDNTTSDEINNKGELNKNMVTTEKNAELADQTLPAVNTENTTKTTTEKNKLPEAADELALKE